MVLIQLEDFAEHSLLDIKILLALNIFWPCPTHIRKVLFSNIDDVEVKEGSGEAIEESDVN